MLTNTGPLPDGSIHPYDVKSLRLAGKRIRKKGWLKPEEVIPPDSWGAPQKDDNVAAVG